MVPDVLGTEPPGRRPASVRRRRWLAGALAMALAAGAFVLASRSEPEPRTRVAPPSPAATPQLPPRWIPGDEVEALGTTSRWAYALIASCRPEGCRHRLARRSLGSGDAVWRDLAGLPTRPDAAGIPFGDLVTAGEQTVAIVDRASAQAWVSDDGGTHFRSVPSLPGRAVPAVPDGLRADLGRCAGCQGQVSVFDPATGRRSRLATQPPLDPAPTAFADSGSALWAASATEDRITVATSVDRGRTWRTTSLPQTTPLRGDLHLAATGRTGFLVAESLDRRFPVQVWVSRDETVRWTRLRSHFTLVGEVTGVAAGGGFLTISAGGALFTEVGSAVEPVGTGPLPDVDGLAAGTGIMLARVDSDRPSVLVSSDPVSDWRLEALPV